jgi:hypothetical protein
MIADDINMKQDGARCFEGSVVQRHTRLFCRGKEISASASSQAVQAREGALLTAVAAKRPRQSGKRL